MYTINAMRIAPVAWNTMVRYKPLFMATGLPGFAAILFIVTSSMAYASHAANTGDAAFPHVNTIVSGDCSPADFIFNRHPNPDENIEGPFSEEQLNFEFEADTFDLLVCNGTSCTNYRGICDSALEGRDTIEVLAEGISNIDNEDILKMDTNILNSMFGLLLSYKDSETSNAFQILQDSFEDDDNGQGGGGRNMGPQPASFSDEDPGIMVRIKIEPTDAAGSIPVNGCPVGGVEYMLLTNSDDAQMEVDVLGTAAVGNLQTNIIRFGKFTDFDARAKRGSVIGVKKDGVDLKCDDPVDPDDIDPDDIVTDGVSEILFIETHMGINTPACSQGGGGWSCFGF